MINLIYKLVTCSFCDFKSDSWVLWALNFSGYSDSALNDGLKVAKELISYKDLFSPELNSQVESAFVKIKVEMQNRLDAKFQLDN